MAAPRHPLRGFILPNALYRVVCGMRPCPSGDYTPRDRVDRGMFTFRPFY